MQSLPEDVREIVDSSSTISDKIRRLDGQGVPRAQIARYLGKRYQHVRNVLEAGSPSRPVERIAEDPLRAAERPAAATSISASVDRFPVELDGSIRLPAALVRTLGAAPGELVVAQAVDGEVTLMSRTAALRRARALFRQVVPAETDAVGAFLAWKAESVIDEDRA